MNGQGQLAAFAVFRTRQLRRQGAQLSFRFLSLLKEAGRLPAGGLFSGQEFSPSLFGLLLLGDVVGDVHRPKDETGVGSQWGQSDDKVSLKMITANFHCLNVTVRPGASD